MKIIAIAALCLVAIPCWAGEATYRPGGKAFADTWHQFYDLGDHEPELDDPLIRRGKSMVPEICAAVAHKDMKYRRYALGALGYIRDSKALPCLERILQDETEIEYFRGDALQSIYLIDQPLGKRYAERHKDGSGYLKMIHDLIKKNTFPLGSTGLPSEP